MNLLKRIVQLLFFISSLNSFSQNLVPNPSFEIVSTCPNNYNQVSGATGWFPSWNNNNPTYGTDYCNACGTPTFQVPTNTWGYQIASTGVAYMAEVTMAPTVQPDYRENIYTQLSSPLVVGTSYFVSFKISHTDNSQYASNNFGVKFATVPNFPINNISHIYSTTIINDKQNWVTISGCFVADSAYQYICLGNFFTDANTLTSQICPSCSFVLYGYYVDDISVVSGITPTISSPSTICNGDMATLSVSGGGNYLWSNGNTTSSIIVSPTSTTSYSVIVSIGSCSDTANTSVSVVPSTTVNACCNTTITSGNTTSLSASGSGNYSWSNGSITSVIAVSPASTTVYYVTTTNSFGCTDVDTVIVFVIEPDCGNPEKDLFIPNAFSPNDDGENDVLIISYTKGIACISSYYLTIFNRWGEKVFETEKISDAWDGKLNGKFFDPAVFTYFCKATTLAGQEAIKKGNITLLK